MYEINNINVIVLTLKTLQLLSECIPLISTIGNDLYESGMEIPYVKAWI